jgi:hypothetical protein
MRIKVLVVLVLLALLSSYPAWEFFKGESALFEKRQNAKLAVLADSLYGAHLDDERIRSIKSMPEWKNYSLEMELARASTELERLRVELKILEWKKSLLDDEDRHYSKLTSLVSQMIDSDRAELNKLKCNSPVFLFVKKVSIIGGDKAEAFESVKAKVLASLQSPSTAKFASFSDDQTIVGKNGTRYGAASYVDAQNAYGAIIRQRYFGVIERGKDGKFRLLAFQLY